MKNTKKLLYSLYAAGAVLGASMLSGCQTVYVTPDGYPTYAPTRSCSSDDTGQILSGILMGIGQGLSAL